MPVELNVPVEDDVLREVGKVEEVEEVEEEDKVDEEEDGPEDVEDVKDVEDVENVDPAPDGAGAIFAVSSYRSKTELPPQICDALLWHAYVQPVAGAGAGLSVFPH